MSRIKRTDIINDLVNKFGYTFYLEIGVKDPRKNFDQISINNKDGIDPVWKAEPISGNKFEMTSDVFFDRLDKSIKYDLVFVDGLHHSEQIDKDIINSLKHLNWNGTIVLHDCNPIREDMQRYPRVSMQWTGDGWKSILKLRCSRTDLIISVIAADFGCGIIRRGKQEIYNIDGSIENYLNWKYFSKNRKRILNLVSVERYEKWLKCLKAETR